MSVKSLQLRACRVDLASRKVTHPDGSVVSLTSREAELLGYLAARPEQVVTSAELLTEVWGYRAHIITRAIHNTMRRLRSKVEQDPAQPTHLLTEFGVGFRFVPGALVEPAPTTDMLGRSTLVTQITTALRGGARLVTLTGPGGVGKTTLAQHIISAPTLVKLEDVRDSAGMIARIAATLSVPGARDPQARLINALAGRGPLLIGLDNLEQIPDAGPVLSRLLTGCPELTILATSRAALRIGLEQVIPVPPLASGPAQALLLARAAQAGASWSEDAPALDELVEALDRLPLALELAAGRAALLSPSALLGRLQRSLSVLRSQQPPHRHSTLSATIAWSWGLLTPPQQDLLARLSVFSAPLPLDAIEALCPPEDTPEVLDLLDALVRHGLVMATSDRFSMMRAIRAFAAEQLVANRLDAQARHSRWCAENPSIGLADLMQATAHAVDCSDTQTAVAAGLAALRLQARSGPLRPGRLLAQQLLALPLSDEQRSRISVASAQLAWSMGESELALAEATAALPSAAGAEATALLLLIGQIEEKRGSTAQAQAAYARGQTTPAAPPALVGRLAIAQAVLLGRHSPGPEAENALRRAVWFAGQNSDAVLEAEARYHLGFYLGRIGRSAEALDSLQALLPVLEDIGAPAADHIRLLSALGRIGMDLDHPQAPDWTQQARQRARRLGDRRREAILTHNLAWIRLDQRSHVQASSLAGEAVVGLEVSGMFSLAQSARLAQGIGLLLSGQPSVAITVLTAGLAALSDRDVPDTPQGPMGAWLALALALSGQPAAAAARLSQAQAVVAPSVMLNLSAAEWAAVSQLVAHLAAHPDAAASVAGALEAGGRLGLGSVMARLQ